MTTTLAIALAAGIASALLLGTIVSGSLIGVFVSYLAPLPVLVAGLARGHRTALLAAGLAAAILGLVVTPQTSILYLVSIGAPACLSAYLALLARPVAGESEEQAGGMEWYPAGNIMFWLAGLGILAALIALVRLAGDMASYASTMRAIAEAQFPQSGASPFVLPEGPNRERILNFVVMTFPSSLASMFLLVHAFNLWLADRVVRKLGGRVSCPRPALGLGEITMPAEAGYMLIVGVVGALVLPGMAAIVAIMVAVSMAAAFAVSGLGLVHQLTQRTGMRGLVLGAFYTLLAVLPWLVLPVILLGLADTFGDVRQRIKTLQLQSPSSEL